MIDPLPLKIFVLAGLAFQGVTLILYVLARQHQIATERHDLVRAAQLRRQEYLQVVEERRNALDTIRPGQHAKPWGGPSPAGADPDPSPAGQIAPATPPAAKAA